MTVARNIPQTHRALRLAIAVCAAGGGFCLVLAMVTLVVALNGTPRPATTVRHSSPSPTDLSTQASPTGRHHSPQTSGQEVPGTLYFRYGIGSRGTGDAYQVASEARRLRATAPAAELAGKFAIARTIAVYHGTGPGTQRSFKIAARGEWGISWEFHCADGRRSRFSVRESRSGSPKGMTLSSVGPRGRGLSWNTLDPGTHELSVKTNCSWMIRIVAPSA